MIGLSLGSLVFSDAAALRDLNRMTHPWILRRCSEEVDRLRAGGYLDIILLDAALLLDWRDQVRPRWIVAVLCAEGERLRRLVARGLSTEEARRRLESQRDQESLRVAATWVVENDGTLEELAQRSLELTEQIRAARARGNAE